MKDLMTIQDFTTAEKIVVLKQQLKKLETADYKKRMANTFEAHASKVDETGAVLAQAGAKIGRIKKTEKSSVSYAKMLKALVDEDTINERKPEFSSPSTSYKFEIVGREKLGATVRGIPKVA